MRRIKNEAKVGRFSGEFFFKLLRKYLMDARQCVCVCAHLYFLLPAHPQQLLEYSFFPLPPSSFLPSPIHSVQGHKHLFLPLSLLASVRKQCWCSGPLPPLAHISAGAIQRKPSLRLLRLNRGRREDPGGEGASPSTSRDPTGHQQQQNSGVHKRLGAKEKR